MWYRLHNGSQAELHPNVLDVTPTVCHRGELLYLLTLVTSLRTLPAYPMLPRETANSRNNKARMLDKHYTRVSWYRMTYSSIQTKFRIPFITRNCEITR